MNDGARQTKEDASIFWGTDATVPSADPLGDVRRLLAAGETDAADKACMNVIARDVSNYEAQHIKAKIEMSRGEWISALDWLQRAGATDETLVDIWIDRGRCCTQLGKWADATVSFTRASELQPENAEVKFECGLCLFKQNKLDEAIDAFRQSASLDNTTPDAYIQISECYFKKREFEDCLGSAQRALQVSNRNAKAYDVYGRALAALGQTKEAISAFRAAIKLDPVFASPYANMAKGYLELGQSAQALEASIQAVQINPDLTTAQVSRASALRLLGHIDEAMVACHKAILTHVNIPDVHMVLAMVYLDSGLPDEAAKAFERGLKIDEDNRSMHSGLVVARQHSAKTGAESVMEEIGHWQSKFGEGKYPRPKVSPRVRKVGILCGGLHESPSGHYALALSQGLKENAIEVFFYAYGREDDFTLRLQDLGHWRSITGLDDETASTIIAEDEVDALIDLTGHAESNRFGILLMRPCGRQVGWLGHQGPYGSEVIDAVIGDPIMHPAQADHFQTSPVLRLPNHGFCFSPLAETPNPFALPSLATKSFNFGAVCSTRNINRHVIAAWSEILKSTPGSQLLIKAKGLNSTAIRKQFINWFHGHGVSEDRIQTFGNTSWSSHMAIFEKIDVCLDTFPCSGLTNCFEAAWMGVPTITFAGAAPWERGAAAIMQGLGLDEFTSSSQDTYVARAIDAAHQKEKLAHLRGKLRGMITDSPLCNSKQFGHDFVAALESIT